MINNSAKIMFFSMLLVSTMITISSNSWLSAWMGLEINLLSFIPLMSDNNNNNLMSTEASLKYFLIQTIASAILLFCIIMMYMDTLLLQNNYLFSKWILISSLLLKSGTAPFHFWFPTVMEGLSWNNNLILMTWQKIAPMMLISYLININFMNIVIIMSIIIGSLGGLNQISLRKLMAFSSITHLGWMLAAMQINEMLWMTYFWFYSFLSFSMIFLFKNFEIYYINQLFNSFFNLKILKFILLLNLLSLGGLPPFIGFLPKWLVIQHLIMNNQYLLTTIMVTMSLITLFFYLRLCFSTFTLNYYENNWMFSMKSNNFFIKWMLMISFISTFSLITISIVHPLFY